MSLLWLGFALQLLSVIARGLAAGRWPLGNMFEFAVGGTLAAIGVFLFWSTRRDVRWAGLFITLPTVLILGLATTVLYVEAAELVPALKSSWLVVHVSMATLCAGLFTVGAIASALYLLQARWERTGATNAMARRLPDSPTLDRVAYRTFAFAFPLWTFAVVSGAIWAESAWGRYWGWDPKETWAFITWLIYAGYLHARATAGWKANRAAWIGLIGFASFLFNFVGVNIWIPGLHSYAGL
jgi:cytochrome c-type biogenesis protein CcsB